MNNLPNFVIIGAGKSGTTALYEYLAEHPEVYMSSVKETNFFALEGEEMVNPENDPDQMFHYPQSITSFTDYQNLFNGVKDEKAIGEVSPMYLYSEEAAYRLREKLPNIKIIAILREPVDRLYSRYMHLVRENRQPTESFEDALTRGNIWWKRNDLIQEGFYYTHLAKYYQLFPADQIQVFLYEDLRKDPLSVIQKIYKFIGVKEWFEPDLSVAYNVSGKIQNSVIDKLIGQNSIIKSALKQISPALAEKVTESQNLKKLINKLRKKNLKKLALDAELKAELFDTIYKDEISKLQKLIQRDLSHWMSAPIHQSNMQLQPK